MPDNTVSGGGRVLTTEEVRSLYTDLRAANSGRNQEYMVNRDRYRGIHWGSDALPELPPGHAMLTVNYVRPIVDMTVEMIIGRMPAIQVVPRGTTQDQRTLAEAMEAVLYQSWNQNNAPMVFRRAIHNQVLLRRGILYYYWDNNKKKFCFRSIAPDNFYPVYDGEEIVEAVVVSRRLTRELQRLYPSKAEQIVPDEDGDAAFDEARWTRMVSGQIDALEEPLGPAASRGTSLAGETTVIDWYDREGNWRRVMGEATHTQRLTYLDDCVPFIELPNGVNGDEAEPRSDIEDIWELNLYINQLISASADVLDKFANPVVVDYGSGQDPQVVKRTIQQRGGSVLPARKDARLEYLNWSGMPPDFEGQWGRVMGAIYDISGKPASAFGQTLTNQSGVMTNLSMTPTTRTAESKETLIGLALQDLNRACLRAYEKMMAGQTINARGVKPSRMQTYMQPFGYELVGRDIDGWYENRIKWPSALRTDDPVYVQNIIQQVTSQPPLLNVYDAMELLGYENVEQMLDRLREQLEDPRMHPDRLTAAMGAAETMGAMPDTGELEGLDPGLDVAGDDEAVNMAAESAGNPNRETLVNDGY